MLEFCSWLFFEPLSAFSVVKIIDESGTDLNNDVKIKNISE